MVALEYCGLKLLKGTMGGCLAEHLVHINVNQAGLSWCDRLATHLVETSAKHAVVLF